MLKKRFCLLLALLLCALALVACGQDENGQPKKKEVKRNEVESNQLQFLAPENGDTIAIFDTSLGEIRAVLYPEYAPMAVENFIGLANEGYYNGVTFHRVVYSFVVQSGDATGSGTGGASIWNNNPYPLELTDKLRHYSGALCAARSEEDELSSLSQFYFVQALPGKVDKDLLAQLTESGAAEDVVAAYTEAGGLPYLDYTDTVFGQVYQGLDIIDTIALADTDENNRPLEDIIVNSVTIGTYSAS